MRKFLFFAIAALVIAGVMPKFMGDIGRAPAAVPVKPSASPPQTNAGNRTVVVRGDARGQFQAEGSIDGRRMDFIVDTGASTVALRHRDAARLGIHPVPREYVAKVITANGVVLAAPVRLTSLEVGGIRVYDVQALVLPDEALSDNLLGMSFLSRIRRFEMAGGKLVLEH